MRICLAEMICAHQRPSVPEPRQVPASLACGRTRRLGTPATLSLTLSTFSEERADAFADAEDPAEVVEEMMDQIIIETVDILG